MNAPRLKASELRQQQCEDLRRQLAPMDIGELLALFKEQASIHFGGYFTIFSCATFVKAAFGIPSPLSYRESVAALPGLPTLKEAVIDALVAVRALCDSGVEADAIRAHLARRLSREADEATPSNREVGTFMSLAPDAEELANETWIEF